MKRKSLSGKCHLCGGTFSKTAIGEHLKSCIGAATSKQPKTHCFHLLIEGGEGLYWLHLAVPQNLPLSKLDEFLRLTWLECCGHLSAFTIGEQRYSSYPSDGMDEKSMRTRIGEVVHVDTTFLHEYDYGTTTELGLTVLGVVELGGKLGTVQVLARNEAPEFKCGECDAIATQICSQCAWQGGGWYCDECAESHECGEEMFLPVVNSPRVGVCGYTG